MVILQLVAAFSICGLVAARQGLKPQEWKPSQFAEGEVLTRQRLLATLLMDYDSRIYPIMNTMNASLSLIHIDADEKKNEMLSDVLIAASWYDSRLTYDPSKFGGLTVLNIPAKTIWAPSFAVLYGDIAVLGDRACGDTNVLIEPNGRVTLNAQPCKLATNCGLNITSPVDTTIQTCSFALTVWGARVSDMDLQFNDPEWATDQFSDTSNWALLHLGATSNTITIPTGIYPLLNFSITFQKKANAVRPFRIQNKTCR